MPRFFPIVVLLLAIAWPAQARDVAGQKAAGQKTVALAEALPLPPAPVVEQEPEPDPEPVLSAAEVAESLGLGHRRVASRLLRFPAAPEWIEAAGEADDSQTMLFPVDEGRLSRGFGHVRRAELAHVQHDGVDIVADMSQGPVLVRAAASGIVAYSDDDVRGYGNLVIVLHPDGTTTHYAHLAAAHVEPGERIERGQTLGEMGNTGLSRGPHLHFEWRRDGTPIDPLPLLSSL